ncbi:MAG: methyltransferase domain-containing protein [Bacteroidetes bacterium]|nr:methyltransferase domain-containing protein [Bacteroidota bacterium]
MDNKYIERRETSATKIFDNRSLETDYRTLVPLLREGMRVLDVGCGTGAISSGIARRVGPSGTVTGIDNTARFIESGRGTYQDVPNLTLIHSDLFEFEPDETFDLIVSARVLQWLSNPLDALLNMKRMLNAGGWVSILDYNHEALDWQPEPPESMRQFYATFLRWRQDAGMSNRMADELPGLLTKAGFQSVETFHSDEHYQRGQAQFEEKVGIWSKVAGSVQMVEEGYLDDALRLRAIEEYTNWVRDEAVSMTMKLSEVRGKF